MKEKRGLLAPSVSACPIDYESMYRIHVEPSIQELIELARLHEITEAEHDAQIRSFTYGNTHFENESITRADVDSAVDSLIKYATLHV